MTSTAKTIGIIGGTGRMGAWFADFFSQQGHHVLISSRKTQLTTADIAQRCDVVVLSLLYQVALEKAAEVGPMLSGDQLLMDLCSLKEKITSVMALSTKAGVIGVHPLFGPGAASMAGQNIILCPQRGKHWLEWLKEMFTDAGATVTQTDPATHDRNMALVQGLNHFLSITLGSLLEQTGTRPQELLLFTTPAFRVKMDLMARLFAQNLDMFRDLVSENPHVMDLLNTFFHTARDTAKTLCQAEPDASLAFMERIQEFLGDFCAQGLAESEAFIAPLYAAKINRRQESS